MDFARLLAAIEGETPSGVEVRHDLRFHDLVRLTEPAARAARVNDDGSLKDAAPDVDWNRVISDGQDLASEGRDLRLLVLITRAHYNVSGFAALAEALTFLAQTVTQYWDSLHPALRARDDPSAAALPRLNALRQLENDDSGLLGDMRFGVVLNPRGIGPITGDDLAQAALSDFEMLAQAASGLSQAEKDALVAKHGQRVNRVQAASRGMAAEDAEGMAALIAAITACQAGLVALGTAVAEAAQFGEQPGLVLPDIETFLAQCRTTLEQAISATARDAPMSESNPAILAPGRPDTPGTAPPAAPAPASGTIGSRADVEQSLERIIAFYERTEPSSPIPHLARRMRRMVSMDFLELMEEIAPSGLKEFCNVAGVDGGKKSKRE